MCDPAVEVRRRTDMVRELERRYPNLPDHAALRAVVDAVRAAVALDLDDDDEADRLVAVIAERKVRQHLGIENDAARLDPQPHRRAAAG